MWSGLSKLGAFAKQAAAESAVSRAYEAGEKALNTVGKIEIFEKDMYPPGGLTSSPQIAGYVAVGAIGAAGALAGGGPPAVATAVAGGVGAFATVVNSAVRGVVTKLVNEGENGLGRINFKAAICNCDVERINKLLTENPYLLICIVPDEKTKKSFIEFVVDYQGSFPQSFHAIFVNNLPVLTPCFLESLRIVDGKLNENNIPNIVRILMNSPKVLLESYQDESGQTLVFNYAAAVLQHDDYSHLLELILQKYKKVAKPKVFKALIWDCYDNSGVSDKVKKALEKIAPEWWAAEGQRRKTAEEAPQQELFCLPQIEEIQATKKEEKGNSSNSSQNIFNDLVMQSEKLVSFEEKRIAEERECRNAVLEEMRVLHEAGKKRIEEEKRKEAERKADEIKAQREVEASREEAERKWEEEQQQAREKAALEEERIRGLQEAKEKCAAEKKEKEAEQEAQRKAKSEQSKKNQEAKEKRQVEQVEENKADTERFSRYSLPLTLSLDTQEPHRNQQNYGSGGDPMVPPEAEQDKPGPGVSCSGHTEDDYDGSATPVGNLNEVDSSEHNNGQWAYSILSQQGGSNKELTPAAEDTFSSLATTAEVNTEQGRATQKRTSSISGFLQMACFLTGGLAMLAAIAFLAYIAVAAGIVPPVVAYGVVGVSIAAVGLFGLREIKPSLQRSASELSTAALLV